MSESGWSIDAQEHNQLRASDAPLILPAVLRKAIAILHTHWQHPPALPELASRVACSQAHLHRQLSAVLGEPIYRYINRGKISAASFLLQNSHHSVQEVAYLVGYESPSAFIAAFRRHAGLTPGGFRQQNAERSASVRIASTPLLKMLPERTGWVRQVRGALPRLPVGKGILTLMRYDHPLTTPADGLRYDVGYFGADASALPGYHRLVLSPGQHAIFEAGLPLASLHQGLSYAHQRCHSLGLPMALSVSSITVECFGEEALIREILVPLQ